MSDMIPADMLEAIDAYDGPVTLCPALAPAEPIDAVARRIIRRDLASRTRSKAQRDAQSIRQAVIDGRIAGKTLDQIAEETGRSRRCISEHSAIVTARGDAPPRSWVSFKPGTHAARVIELGDGTRTVEQVAALLGSTVNSVNVMAGRARRAGHDVRFVGGKKFKPISKHPGGEGCLTLSTTTRTSCE